MERETSSVDAAVAGIQKSFPRIYVACHRKHRRAGNHGSDLSDRESTILAHLSRDRPTNHADLAEHLGIVPSTLSEALDPLEEAGLIRRVPDPGDRRRSNLLLTDRGVEARSGTSVLDRGILTAALDGMEASERAEVAEALEALATACQSARRELDERKELEQ